MIFCKENREFAEVLDFEPIFEKKRERNLQKRERNRQKQIRKSVILSERTVCVK